MGLGISRTSVHRILKNDLALQAYKLPKEPLLPDEHEEKRIKFANWIRTNFQKGDTMKILFSDEKIFDIDGVQKPIPEVVSGKNGRFPERLYFG